MSEQARIETAIDTTIDNCEVLRARLAKYEDADGKPITTIAEQAREIEKLEAGIPRLQEQLYQQRKELTALKPQPSGVVLPERDDASAYEAFYTEKAKTLPLPLGNAPLRYSGGQYINDFALFGWMVWEACLSEVVRLNQPAPTIEPERQVTDGGRNPRYEGLFEGESEEQRASRLAGDDDDQAYDIEAERLTYEALGPGAGINPNATSMDDIFLTESTGEVGERAAFEAWYETTYGISLEPEFRANHFIGYVNDKANHRWTAWQASRAALCVELPDTGQCSNHSAYKLAINDCKNAIHAAGVKTK